jgi:hypothetical protein
LKELAQLAISKTCNLNRQQFIQSTAALLRKKKVLKCWRQFRAEKLDKKDLFGKSDPFYVISKSMPNGQV